MQNFYRPTDTADGCLTDTTVSKAHTRWHLITVFPKIENKPFQHRESSQMLNKYTVPFLPFPFWK